MHATATQPAVLTIPEVSLALNVHLDRLRRAVRRIPELRDLTAVVGSARVVRVADLERVRQLLDRPRG